MSAWQALKCLIGWHSWRIASEVEMPGTGYTDNPMDYECGGVDYIIRCAHCPHAYVDRRRGVWIKPKFPRADAEPSDVEGPHGCSTQVGRTVGSIPATGAMLAALQEAINEVIAAGGARPIQLDSMWLEKAQASIAGARS